MSLIFTLDWFICGVFYIVSNRYNLEHAGEFVKSCVWGGVGVFTIGKFLSVCLRYYQVRDWSSSILTSGFTFYFGFIGGIIGLWIYSKIRNQSVYIYSDVVCSILPLAQAIGRFACFFNGCCYGKQYDGFGAIHYPVEDGVWQSVVPTWFIESFFCGVIFLAMQKKNNTEVGAYTYQYVLMYGVIRILTEFLRGDSLRGVYGCISTSQIVSFLLIVLVLILKRSNSNKNYMFIQEAE